MGRPPRSRLCSVIATWRSASTRSQYPETTVCTAWIAASRRASTAASRDSVARRSLASYSARPRPRRSGCENDAEISSDQLFPGSPVIGLVVRENWLPPWRVSVPPVGNIRERSPVSPAVVLRSMVRPEMYDCELETCSWARMCQSSRA